jgi:hypothetical protein
MTPEETQQAKNPGAPDRKKPRLAERMRGSREAWQARLSSLTHRKEARSAKLFKQLSEPANRFIPEWLRRKREIDGQAMATTAIAATVADQPDEESAASAAAPMNPDALPMETMLQSSPDLAASAISTMSLEQVDDCLDNGDTTDPTVRNLLSARKTELESQPTA